MASKIVKVFFDGVEKDCLVTPAKNGEILCIAKDRSFIKFPAAPEGQDQDAWIDEQVALNNNDESNVVVPKSGEEEAAAKAELEAWLDPLPESEAEPDAGAVSEVDIRESPAVDGGSPNPK